MAAVPPPLLFVVSAPRSGSTLLERILETHSHIHGGPEAHLLTPLAHSGYWDKTHAAPYDPDTQAEALQAFVEGLPNGEATYWQACRDYAGHLYARALEG